MGDTTFDMFLLHLGIAVWLAWAAASAVTVAWLHRLDQSHHRGTSAAEEAIPDWSTH